MSAGLLWLALSTYTRHADGLTPVPLAPSVQVARMRTMRVWVYLAPFLGESDVIQGRNPKAVDADTTLSGNVVKGLPRSAMSAQLVLVIARGVDPCLLA